ncbi:MAG: phosphoribosylglycinamide formyltransferase [Pseudomonadota bacterium]
MSKTRVAILFSGRGTNLQALIDAAASDDFPAEITLALSNRPDAEGLTRARDAGVTTRVIDHKAFGKGEAARAAFEAPLQEALDAAKVDFICLAGFMRVFTSDFTRAWRGRMINMHPSLLPAFRGVSVHERTIESGAKIAGCTVHFVSSEVDAGPIIGQAALAVRPADTPETLAARILELEHRLYPTCLRLLAEGKARLGANDRVTFDASLATDEVIVTPMA